jgi:hypothetical protein
LDQSAPRIFGAQCHSYHSAAIYTLAALRRLSHDNPRFKLRIMPLSKNTDLEIRVAQFDLRCFVVNAYDNGEPMFVEVVKLVRASQKAQARKERLQEEPQSTR